MVTVVSACLLTDKPRRHDPNAKALLHCYCAIDYPLFMDKMNLVLHRMWQQLKAELEDKDPLVHNVCPVCDSQFTSQDFALLLDRETLKLRCDEWQTPVVEQLGSAGQTGTAEDREVGREVRF